MEKQPENTSAASEQQIPTEAPSPLPVDEKPPAPLERTKEEEAVPDLPPPMSDAEIMASMGQSPDYEQDYYQPETYNSIELVKTEEKAVEQQAESSAQDYRRDAIEQAIHDTDIQEQIQHGEAPDSMKDKADKAFAIANDTELQKSQADYEDRMRRQNAEQAQTATPTESKPQNQPQLEFRIPDSVAAQYRTNGNEKYMLDPRTDKLAIDARSENILKTRNNDKKTIENMLAIAETNGWQNIKVKGSPEFKKEMWLQARLKGLEVQGYKPSEQDKKLLETRKAQLERGINSISKENNPSQKVAEPTRGQSSVPADGERIVTVGSAPYLHNAQNKESPYIVLERDGKERTVWGVDIPDAMERSGAEVGDHIRLHSLGRQPVEVEVPIYDKNGKVTGMETKAAYRNMFDMEIVREQDKQKEQVRQTSGKLMGYGVGIHPNNKEGKNTYYVDIQKSNGQTERFYGHGLRDAIIQSKAERGDNITLTKTGHNGKNNTWQADVSKQKTASQKLIDAARTSGSPEALKMAQQAFARDHLAKRAEQTIKADREARRNDGQEVKLPQKQKEKSADIEMTR